MTSPRSLALALIVTGAAMPLVLAAGPDPAPVGRDAVDADRAREIGLQASRALQQQLGGALTRALQDGGPAAAVAVCADTAQVLTARIARDLDVPGLALKRTSLRLRNPANRPDSLETAVLQAFTAALAAGEPVTPHLEHTEDGYRYFAPITTRGFCLQCHGPRESLAKGVPTVLAERYPQDGATGHAAGDLRGVVSVTIPARAGHGDLRDLVAMLTGSFSSAAQAAADTNFYDIRLEMVPIWSERTDPEVESYIYVEQASASALDQPYRQRVYHVTRGEDGAFLSAVYTLPDPTAAVGAWRSAAPLADLSPADLSVREGCTVYLRRQADGSFAGSTRAKDCTSDLRGATYATSEITISADEIRSWDRGWSADDEQVWGAETGGYVFRRTTR